MTKYLVKVVINLLNAFPSTNGISQTMSPEMIVQGKQKLDFSKRGIYLGAYLLVCTVTTNVIKSWNTPVIDLRTSNDAVVYYFMSSFTGKQLHSYLWE